MEPVRGLELEDSEYRVSMLFSVFHNIRRRRGRDGAGKFIDNNEREKRGKEAETRSRVVGLGRSRDVPEGQPTADCNFKAKAHESVIHEEKDRRADGGCLGFRRRRRTRQAAKMHGEPQAGIDPCVSEWGNPAGRSPVTGQEPGRTRGTETSQYPQEEKESYRLP